MQLGDKVKVSRYYKKISATGKRYELQECDKVGFVAGKRSIQLSGETKDNQVYIPGNQTSTYLVAINMKQALYVPLDGLLKENNNEDDR